jgi:succinoglycan biosynthesis protein ExoA
MTVKHVSIIAPMLNEARHVEDFVGDIAAQDFQGDVELLVADGGSTDDSVGRLRHAAHQHGVALNLVANPSGWVSHGLNECIRSAAGDLLVRLDCHSRYPSNYLRLCALAAEETGALVVGGVIVAEGQTVMERSIACAMDTPFGGIGFYRVFAGGGGTFDRLAGAFGLLRARSDAENRRVDTDTLTFGAFRPEAFRVVGLFDESLRRNQDDEFNLRVRRSGGRVVLDPAIRVHYTPRGSWHGVFRQYFEYGYWKVPVMLKHRELPGPRSLIPPAFVLSLGILLPGSARFRLARALLAAELALYAALALASGATSIRRRRESIRLLPRVCAVFPAFHLGYGYGMLRGFVRAAGLHGGRAFGR